MMTAKLTGLMMENRLGSLTDSFMLFGASNWAKTDEIDRHSKNAKEME